MKQCILICFSVGLLFLKPSYAGQEYMLRFKQYLEFSQHMPKTPDAAFLNFVTENKPLANKLRDKWLYELALNKNWTTYSSYYQDTHDLNLICYKHMATYHSGFHQKAFADSNSIWLEGTDKPPSCNALFDLLKKDPEFKEHLITERINAALENNNTQQALLLMKLYKNVPIGLIKTLLNVYQNPLQISKIPPSELKGSIYLYGLKRLAVANMDKAIKLWQSDKNKKILNNAQQQAFYAHIALYKAIRSHDDTLEWFAKITPDFYNDTLVEWQIRYALKFENWTRATHLIQSFGKHELPVWNYWWARASKATTKHDSILKADEVFKELSKTRNYYGFLASHQQKHTSTFSDESSSIKLNLLQPYQSILNQIQTLYLAKQENQASRLLNDFISELPKNEACALVSWLATQLHWYSKSVNLANSDLLNDQLNLRFPLAYDKTVAHYANYYSVPPELIYAIIRQESSFRVDAISSAGARGLMQLMPNTARLVSALEKINYKNPNQLFLYDHNIHIGTAYIKQLAKRFNNHPILIAAAYNAGPKQVVNWIKTHPPNDVDLWIETLPWQETRNYLKNVMAFYVVYQHRLHKKSDLNPFLKPFKTASI